ncbi:hypothetical protein [Umezawaea tangerina]|uniref:Uncharacterized protein n=1 Tax=Umezawaea tangerina TaxID=84725 RepID=A0A2T0T4B9_9PSEU|nr:hypothetical protein [Umezawaea tangerina]PRY40512.1 hypothetical protein CLV43_106249 [Umezawaea tangerina]
MTPEVRVLLAGMSNVNSELSRYILRSLDVQNGLSEAGFSAERETALGQQMVSLGEALQLIAERRRQILGSPDTTAAPPGVSHHNPEGDVPQP